MCKCSCNSSDLSLLDATLDKYSRQFVANINNLISTGTYKGQTYNNYVVLGQNSSIFDIPKMQIFGGNTIDTTNHLDLYQANLMIQDVLGPNAMYAKGVKASSKYGRATQENLSISHGYKVSGKAAHIAQTDQEELARMMIQPMKAKMDLIADEFEKGVYKKFPLGENFRGPAGGCFISTNGLMKIMIALINGGLPIITSKPPLPLMIW